jgi:hypothetical protein
MDVVLSVEIMQRCDDYGLVQATAYATGLSSTARSSHGIERDPVRLALARKAECALCVALALDPLTALDWSQYPDPGFDAKWFGVRIDVKQTVWRNRYLCYPGAKVVDFHRHGVDIFVLVKSDPPLFRLAGFVTKARFKAKHQVEPGAPGSKGPHGLDAGTWFMHERDLTDIALLARWMPEMVS